ncbi:MAG: FemAB family XrtA/PEP-CTERM system-associated protein [Pirellula sp.]
MEIKTYSTRPEVVGASQGSLVDCSSLQPAWAWWDAIACGLGHRPYYLVGSDSQREAFACLPLMLVKSKLFGSFLVSLPYLNSGGLVFQGSSSIHDELCHSLIDRAVQLADALDVKHLELRHEVRFEHPAFNYERTDKVHMRLALPSSPDELMASFKSKLRSQVKKANENPFEVHFGGEELLADFYGVFAHNMRDLGTPVYSKNLFRHALRSFANSKSDSRAELAVVRLNHQPISGALIVHHAHRTEVPSASALRSFNPTNVNMWMYWNLLRRAIELGSTEFDFGRSTVGAGTYKFKEQWGAKPSPAIWQYYVRKGDPSSMRPDDEGKQRLVKIWQRLPVWFTKLIGPAIVRGIP